LNVRAAVAENPKTPLVALHRLARIKDSKVIAGLANNPLCPIQLLSLSAARRWRYDLVKLAKTLPAGSADSLSMLPQDESISETFRDECRNLISSPQHSIIAKLISAETQQKVLELEGEHTRSAARSSVRAIRLRGLRHRKADPLVLVKTYRSTDWIERLAIAGNPAAPLNVINALAKDPHRLVALCAKATAQVKSAESNCQTDALADETLRFDSVPFAQEVVNRLKLLEDEREIQHLVGTSWWDFLTPFQRYCSADLNHAPYALTVPNSLPHAIQIRLLKACAMEKPYAVVTGSQSTSEILMDLAKHVNEDVRQCVAEFKFTPIVTFELLSKDKKDRVRYTVAENPAAPAEVLRRLAKLKDEFIRAVVAGNISAPLDLLEKLAIDSSVHVRKGVAGNMAAPVSIRQALLDRLALETEGWTQLHIALNPLTSSDVRVAAIAKLMTSPSAYLRKEIASTPIISEYLLEQLGVDLDEGVRAAVGANPNTRLATLERLATDPSIDVRQAVARNSATPVGVLQAFALEADDVVLKAIAFNPSTPVPLRAGVLEKLVTSTETAIRIAVAQNNNSPESVLRQLAADRDIKVRLAVASNPSTHPEVLEQLSQHANLRPALFRNPTTPTDAKLDLIEHMSKDEDQDIRKMIAESPLTPAGVLETLSRDDDVWVKNAVAKNPASSGGVLMELACKGFWALRLNAMSNPAFPPDHYETALTAVTAEIENALAPAAPIITERFAPSDFIVPLRILGVMPDELDRKSISKAAKSKDWLQRAASILCEGVLPGELRRLMDDEIDTVKFLAILRLKGLNVAKTNECIADQRVATESKKQVLMSTGLLTTAVNM
jgi:hypothetical protein